MESLERLRSQFDDRDINIVKTLPNGTYLVSYQSEYEFVDNRFGVLPSKKDKYNIMRADGTLACAEWFDEYEINKIGECIIKYDKYLDYGESVSHLDIWKVRNIPYVFRFRYGFVDRNGNLMVEPFWEYLRFGGEDTIIVSGSLDDKRYTLVGGYVDTITGQNITPIVFEETCVFSDGLAGIRYGDMYGYVRRDRIMTDPNDNNQYAFPLLARVKTFDFHDGRAKIWDSDTRQSYYIDKTGNKVEGPYIRKKQQ